MSLTFTKVNPPRPSSVSLSLSFSIPSSTPPHVNSLRSCPEDSFHKLPLLFFVFLSIYLNLLAITLQAKPVCPLTGHQSINQSFCQTQRSGGQPGMRVKLSGTLLHQAQPKSLSLSPSYPHSSSVSLVPSFPVTLSHSCQPTLSRCQSESARTNNTLPLTLTNGANLPRLHRHDHGPTDTQTHVCTCVCGRTPPEFSFPATTNTLMHQTQLARTAEKHSAKLTSVESLNWERLCIL